MIIQCEKCRTKFRLDDSRVSDKGVKVRCTKCKYVFRVEKEGAEAGTFVSEEPQNTDSGKVFAAAVEPAVKVYDEVDFSDDDMFGAVVQPAPEAPGEAISFDFEGGGFAESMDMSGQDTSGKGSALFSHDPPLDAPFDLGEIDFGDELTSVAVQRVNPEDLKPSQEILFAPLAEAQVRPEDSEVMQSVPGEERQELPPLPISSRGKQSPLFGILIGVVALLVLSVLGYVGYSSLSTPREVVVPENGKIGVKTVKAVYIKNAAAGELLVISGEAVNEYSEPRAALQVKVTLFGAAGESLATKSAYGGNPLTEEQLKSLSLDKFEAAMANQFGDSLANMEVAPGRAIPFVVVLADIPEGVADFAVQSAGSTVATGKQ